MFRSLAPFFSPCIGWYTSTIENASPFPFTSIHKPIIRLDLSKIGRDVVILKEGSRICGTGGALATVPILQDKAYFHIILQQAGTWGVGLGNKDTSLNSVPIADKFWGLKDNGEIVNQQEVVGKLDKIPEEGDIIGITYDHIQLRIYHNGKEVSHTITGIKGPVYPLVYVDDSAILDVKFQHFLINPPAGFSEILVEQTIL